MELNCFSLLLVLVLSSQLHLPITDGVIYCVKPTEPCTHNSSCSSSETCHTMDHYASNSSYYFSPDHINVTLYFMHGVHNCTKYINVHDLHLFTMTGGAAGRDHVMIYMPIPNKIPQDPESISNNTYMFTNISHVTITNATVHFISLHFRGQNCCLLTKSVDFLAS